MLHLKKKTYLEKILISSICAGFEQIYVLRLIVNLGSFAFFTLPAQILKQVSTQHLLVIMTLLIGILCLPSFHRLRLPKAYLIHSLSK